MAVQSTAPTDGTARSLSGMVALFETMLTARAADRREAILVRQGVGRFHVSGSGHESIAVLAAGLRPDDLLFPYYRDRALVLARGMSIDELAVDFVAGEGSDSAGRTMPEHYSDRRRGIYSVASPVASGCLPAAGAAWRCQLAGQGQLVLHSLGEGGTRQGEFFEAVCLAIHYRLPLVIAVQANGYAISTPTDGATPLDFGLLPRDLCREVDGCDIPALREAGKAAFARARAGGGPTVLWCRLERLDPHSSADDHRQYRSEDELRAAAERDPLLHLGRLLARTGELDQAAQERLRDEVTARVDACYAAAARAPAPATELAAAVYGPEPTPDPPPPAPEPPGNLAEAVNQVLAAALETMPEVLLYGQDIEDPRGGVFGLTRGLSTRFAGRVVNSPLAEATLVGAGVGLAATGLRPIIELQFIDFITPGFNQLATQAATLRWRTDGDWTCPLVLYAPCGAYISGGIWHSQTNEGWWTHMPGVRVAVPSFAEDALALFWAALHADDPTLLLLPKRRLRLRQDHLAAERLPFGRARILRRGSEATAVCWGNCVEWAGKAADLLADEGIALEVIDLRTLVPCDLATVRESLERTGRLVVVEEDSRTGSFGMNLIAELTSSDDHLALHLAAPRRVGRGDHPVPYAESLEAVALPHAEDVVAAVRAMLE